MIEHFRAPWPSVPTVWIDVETTGADPSVDRAVQVAIVRFEAGAAVGQVSALVNPHRPIGETAGAIHGITDAQVADAPDIGDVWRSPEAQRLLNGAQPGAYNAPFDRCFVPPYGSDWAWPWLDALSIVREVDRFERGKGRHKLTAACERHGIKLEKAHDAASDAAAAGALFYAIAPKQFGPTAILGDLLHWQRNAEADQWYQFNAWLAAQGGPSA